MRDTCTVPLIPIVGILALNVPCFTEPLLRLLFLFTSFLPRTSFLPLVGQIGNEYSLRKEPRRKKRNAISMYAF